MRIFFNKNFTKRNYECTNIVACTADVSPNENYIEVTTAEAEERGFNKLTKLWIQNNTAFYGYL